MLTVGKETKPSEPLRNLKHEAFVRAYVNPEQLANGTLSYAQAYNVDKKRKGWQNQCNVAASRLLRDAIVLKRIQYLIEHTLGFNPEDVDKELSFLIRQSADLKVKLGAIKEFNMLKGRITRKLDIAFTDTSDEQLENELNIIEAELKKADHIEKIARSEREKNISGLPDLTDEQRNKLKTGELLP